MRDHPTSIGLPHDLKVYLESQCTKDSRSMTWLINHILRRWMTWRQAQSKGKTDGA